MPLVSRSWDKRQKGAEPRLVQAQIGLFNWPDSCSQAPPRSISPSCIRPKAKSERVSEQGHFIPICHGSSARTKRRATRHRYAFRWCSGAKQTTNPVPRYTTIPAHQRLRGDGQGAERLERQRWRQRWRQCQSHLRRDSGLGLPRPHLRSSSLGGHALRTQPRPRLAFFTCTSIRDLVGKVEP